MTTTFDIGYRSGWELTVSQNLKLETIICADCGLIYALPKDMLDRARSLGERKITWTCPNGHGRWGFSGPSEAEKLRQRLASEREHSGRLAAERDQLAAAERDQRAAKTRFRHERDRLRTRAAAGVCPCCTRSFTNLRDHMAMQHPDFPPAEGGGE